MQIRVSGEDWEALEEESIIRTYHMKKSVFSKKLRGRRLTVHFCCGLTSPEVCASLVCNLNHSGLLLAKLMQGFH